MTSALAVYIVGIVGVYYSLAIRVLTGYRGLFFALVAILLLGFIAIFRGSVGTDTSAYEHIFDALRTLFGYDGYEPGFSILVWMLSWFTESNVVLVRLVSVLFVFGLIIYILRSDEDELFILLAYFLPVFFYQYSMNALRIGFASVFLLLAIQYFRKNRLTLGFSIVVFGWMFHFSLLISTFFLIVGARLLNPRIMITLSLVAFIFFGAVLLILGESFIARVLAYELMHSPGALSGLSSLTVLLVVLVAAGSSSLSFSDRAVYIIFTTFCMVAAFVLSRYSYAGLRVLDLLCFVAPAALLILHGRHGVNLNLKSKFAFIVAGVIGLLANFRGFLITEGEGLSPFIPFEWIFH